MTVTSTLFIGVVAVFSNSRVNVEFNQAKVDIETKIKGYVNQVSTGDFSWDETHRCLRDADVSWQRPTIVNTPGTRQQCVYMGKALHVVEGGNKIRVYDVLGLRNKFVGGADSNQPAVTEDDAKPEVALSRDNTTCSNASSTIIGTPAGNFCYLFVEEFILPVNLTVTYARSGSTSANILKIYSNLSSGSSSSRGLDIYANSYTAQESHTTNATVRDCIRGNSPCNSKVSNFQTNGWDLCIQNSDDSRRAKINLKPTFTSVVTTITDGQC